MSTQIFDADICQHELTRTLVHCGLWGGKNDDRYSYVLSPCVFGLLKPQQQELELLARGVYAGLESLDEKLLRLGSEGTHLSKGDARFLRLAKTGTRNLLSPRDGKSGLPPIIKVDLVQNTEGKFQIAEVDAYNPRGLGYLCLLDKTVSKRMQRYPGTDTLCTIFASMGKRADQKWFIIVSEFERYYEPAFGVLARSLRERGIQAEIVREQTLNEKSVDAVLGDNAQVLCIPESINRYPDVRRQLMQRYQAGTLHCLFPPKAYLGSKGFLPYLHAHKELKGFIPKTTLVSVHDNPDLTIEKGKPSVLKATVSSGMKQVLFSDLDQELFETQLASARKAENATWILQEQVEQKPVSVKTYNKDGSRAQGEYYFRVIAHITKYGVLDVEITGRQNRKVHGAPDCIQLPSVLI